MHIGGPMETEISATAMQAPTLSTGMADRVAMDQEMASRVAHHMAGVICSTTIIIKSWLLVFSRL